MTETWALFFTSTATYRRHRGLNLIHSNPVMPYTDIAKAVGITRERVRQILKDNGLFTVRNGIIIEKKCPVCGKVMSGTKSQLYVNCSVECARASINKKVLLICDNCGKYFFRKLSEAIRSYTHYCGPKCYHSFGKKRRVE